MKIKCTQENLHMGLSIVGQLATKSSSLPILNNVLLHAEKNSISITTTNLEIGIKTIIRGKVEREGSFTVNARVFSEYISLLPKEIVEISLEKDEVEIKTKKTQTRIKSIPADEFPLLPDVEKSHPFKVSSNELKTAVSQVIFAASHDETRMELSGVLFQFRPNKLVLAATDSFRLSEKSIFFQIAKHCEEKSIIVPARAVFEMSRIATGAEEIDLFVSEGQIAMQSEHTEFVSRIIDGNYPDYTQIIPKEKNTKIVVNREEFIKTIKSASLFCKPGVNDISLNFSLQDNEIIVTAINTQVGENISRLEAQISGQENKGVFNYKYLLDGLGSISTDEVLLELIDQNSPAVIKPKDKSDHLYLVMPIRQ